MEFTPQFVIITCTRIQLIRIFQTPRLSNTVYPIEYGHVRQTKKTTREPVTSVFRLSARAQTTGRMYLDLSARQRTTQNAESGIASSIPSMGPRIVAQKKKLKITPA